MQIKFGTGKDPEWTEINVGSHDVLIQNCFCGIGIETDQGLFGIAQRDGVIEILFDGKLILNSDQIKKMIEDLEIVSSMVEHWEDKDDDTRRTMMNGNED